MKIRKYPEKNKIVIETEEGLISVVKTETGIEVGVDYPIKVIRFHKWFRWINDEG